MPWFDELLQPGLQILRIIGGLGVFLYGMQTMSEGIRRRAGNQLQRRVETLSSRPLLGILIGIGVTALIQSSSATTVILVSMVNAGLVSLRQSIAVIMGANIGTTFTAWIVSLFGFNFEISTFALPAVALSLPLHFSKREERNDYSLILLGFGLLFLGIEQMKIGVSIFEANTHILILLQAVAELGVLGHLIFVLIGAALTFAVQSSSVAMTITLTLVYNGWIPFPLAAALVLGENVGTTLTAYLASIEMSTRAKRAARAHMLFNLIGVFWMLILLKPMLRVVDLLIPGSPATSLGITFHLSGFHTFFNLTNTLLLVWFIPRIEELVVRLVPNGSAGTPAARIPWIRGNMPESTEANLINAQGAIRNLSAQVRGMADHVMNSLDPLNIDEEEMAAMIHSEEETVDLMEEQLLSHLSECALQPLNEEQAQWVGAQLRIIGEFERIADGLLKVHDLGGKSRKKKSNLHRDAMGEMLEISYLVRDFLQYVGTLLEQPVDERDLAIARSMEEEINTFRNSLNKISRKSIKSGGSLKGELLFMEIVRCFENIGDSCIAIAEELSRIHPE